MRVHNYAAKPKAQLTTSPKIALIASVLPGTERQLESPVKSASPTSTGEVLLPPSPAEELFVAAEELGVVAGTVEFEGEEADPDDDIYSHN